jgi:Prokaryotic N-terminal methylation motif
MRRAAGQDGGFTLVELLVVMVTSLIIFGATLTVLEAFNRGTTGNNKRTDAADQARAGVDLLIRQLRNIASPITQPKLIERATPYDIVFQTIGTPSGSNVSGAERVRYCIPSDPSGNSANEKMVSQTQTWTTASAPSSYWTSDPTVTLACPDSSPTTNATVTPYVTNRFKGATQTAFTFNGGTAPSDLTTISSVQIDLFVNPTPPTPAAETELRSAAFLRNQHRSPVASFTYTTTGGGGVLLNGGSAYSPDGQALSYAWSCTSPSPCPSSSTLSQASTGLIDWVPGSGTYTVKLTVTDETGLATSTSQQVVIQ